MCCGGVGLDGVDGTVVTGSWGKELIVESGKSTGDGEMGREVVGGRIEDEEWRGEERWEREEEEGYK